MKILVTGGLRAGSNLALDEQREVSRMGEIRRRQEEGGK